MSGETITGCLCVLLPCALLGATIFALYEDWKGRTAGAEAGARAQVAFRFGLAANEGRLEGRVQGLRLQVCEYEDWDGESTTRAMVRVTLGCPEVCKGFGVRRRESPAWSGRTLTRDDWFDRHLEVRGNSSAALALLTAPVRHLLLEKLPPDTAIENGTLVHPSAGRLTSAPELIALIERCVDCATALRLADPDVSMALARNARSEPDPDVGLRNLEELGAHFAGSAAAYWAVPAALASPDPQVRLAGARLVANREARKCLIGLVASVQPVSSVRVRALKHLLHTWPRAGFRSVLDRALASSVEALQCVAAEAVGSRPDLRPGRQLLAPTTEALLVRLLSSQSTACQLAAARALGRRSSLETVERLLPLTRGVFRARDLRHAARDAIRRIQERAGGRDGGLSLTAGADLTGAVSVSTLEGAVSVAE